MADTFFGFDTSLSNLNDDEGGGEPSEDEYDALNDETFGQGSDEFDWEVEHEQLAEQLESSRRHHHSTDEDVVNSQLEASLSQLVLDEADASRSFGGSVWRHDAPITHTPTPVPKLKNVCTVEELERQIREKHMLELQQQNYNTQNYYQPRYPVILQRPPGLQAPVPLPFAPQQSMTANINQINQPLNKIIGQNNQIPQNNQLMNHMNQLGPNVNQMGPNVTQMPPNVNQISQNMKQFMQNSNQFQNNQMGQNNLMGLQQNMQNLPHPQGNLMANPVQNIGMTQNLPQMGQNMNQMGQNMNQMGQNMNQMGQNMNQIGQNMNQMGHNINQMGQNINQIGQNVNQMPQNVNQIQQNVNQISQNVNQILPNGNQFGQLNQFQHVMGQPRMMVPPPGMNIPRQNFNQNMGQFNPNFRGPVSVKPDQPINQQNLIMNQQMTKNQQMKPIQNVNANQNMNQQMQNLSLPMQNLNQPMQNLNQPMTNMNQPLQNMNQPIQNMNQSIQNMNQPIQTLSQPIPNLGQANQNMGQNNQNLSQSPQNKKGKVEQKQKTRVYNNKNMTSQNLVQLIQNTHPMLQYNFHNANHHPMLNNRNMFNNNNQFNHPILNSQRMNGSYNRHNSLTDDDSSSDTDEYAGLMSQREKQWLINIQMLQLNTGTPYLHDFYYTVFLERQASKEKEGIKEAHKANQQNHPFYSGAVKQETHTHRERHNSNRHNSTSEDGATPRTYVPTQFENSLGKLQCGSVTAPRKIIDVEVVGSESTPSRQSRAPSVASTTNPAEVPRESKRTKQLLLDIEALYLILLRLEEMNDPLAIANALIMKEREEKQKQLEAAQNDEEDCNLFLKNIESVQRRPKQDSPKSESIDKRQVVNLAVNPKPIPVKNLLDEDKDELVNKMFAGLLHSDRLQQMMAVRKGRTLLSRFLSRAGTSHGRLRMVWSRVMRALPSAARRDDGTLAALAHHYHKYIHNTTGWTAILESCSLLSEALDPARTHYALLSSFTLSCVCALVERASLLVNTPDATSNERQWSKFLKTLARALKNTSLTVARPLKPLTETRLTCHLKQLDSRSTIEILQRGKPADFDLTKSEVAEQLVKHLC